MNFFTHDDFVFLVYGFAIFLILYLIFAVPIFYEYVIKRFKK